MAKPQHDWYLNDWLKVLGKKPADISRDLGWNKSRESLTRRGIQPYDREDINELAAYLHLEPFELLLPPDRAMAFRQMRSSAETIVKEVPPPVDLWAEKLAREDRAKKPPKKGTGTHG